MTILATTQASGQLQYEYAKKQPCSNAFPEASPPASREVRSPHQNARISMFSNVYSEAVSRWLSYVTARNAGCVSPFSGTSAWKVGIDFPIRPRRLTNPGGPLSNKVIKKRF
jgi:hypothetical protein